jgi:hypothetical protein
LVGDGVDSVKLLRPGHPAAADERAFEGPVIAKNFGLLVTGAVVGVHCECAVSPTAKLVNALTFFGRVHQPHVVFEHTVGPRLSRIHVSRHRADIIFVFDEANAQVLEAETLSNKQTRLRL